MRSCLISILQIAPVQWSCIDRVMQRFRPVSRGSWVSRPPGCVVSFSGFVRRQRPSLLISAATVCMLTSQTHSSDGKMCSAWCSWLRCHCRGQNKWRRREKNQPIYIQFFFSATSTKFKQKLQHPSVLQQKSHVESFYTHHHLSYIDLVLLLSGP